jgi:hypothetical protein
MRPLWLWAAFLLACSGGSTTGTRTETPSGTPGEFAEDDRFVPTYSKADLSRALQRERGAEATAERVVADLEAAGGDATRRDLAGDDQLRVARADLAVRRRFIAALEACESAGRDCPPRLDDPPWAFDPDSAKQLAPPVTANLRFDVDSWRKLAAELHGRGCACRTLSCVDSVGVAIDQLELRPMPDVQGDEVASLSITRARECLFRLRGKKSSARAPRSEEP